MLSFYIRIIFVLMITFVLYGGVLPNMVSAPDTVSVLLGIALALLWPALAVSYMIKHFRKLKCVKF